MGRRMADGYEALTEKEKETLRLIVRGHDAKSIARHLSLSVHTINERLRDARRKMSVSSSREAARLLLDPESPTPESLTDKPLGDAAHSSSVKQDERRARYRRPAWIAGGVLVMSLFLAALALNVLSPVATPASAPAAAPAAAAETEVVRSARAWLALVDAERWNESWEKTGQPFKQLNTSAQWAAISQAVRPPMGAVRSRTALSQERVPAPPHGYEIVKFQTNFANKPGAVETVSLVREGDAWKVVGYWIA